MRGIDPAQLHHAYLLEGDEVLAAELASFLAPHAAVERDTYAAITVDDARALRSRAQERSLGRAAHIVVAKGINHEAQNALLKALEEPREGLSFFIIVPDAGQLLPTVRSRLLFLPGERREDPEIQALAESFLAQALPERLKLVAKLVEDHEDGESALLRAKAAALLEAAVRLKREQGTLSKEALEDYVFFAPRLPTRGSSPKMVLEYFAHLL